MKTKPKKGKKGRCIGRKSRKMAFQRYKTSDRFMDGIKRHLKEHPNDKYASITLDKMMDAANWVGWRKVQKSNRMATR